VKTNARSEEVVRFEPIRRIIPTIPTTREMAGLEPLQKLGQARRCRGFSQTGESTMTRLGGAVLAGLVLLPTAGCKKEPPATPSDPESKAVAPSAPAAAEKKEEKKEETSVAVAAFDKYKRKSMATEAVEALAKLKVGAKVYYQSDRYDEKGNARPKAFTEGKSDWSPKTPCCDQPGRVCKPDATAWSQSPWKELFFQMTDPHRYQFRVDSTGEGAAAKFVAEARGDLNCDGKFSSYKITGSVDKSGDPVFEEPVVENELE
jgi:hypothetical protein